MRYVQRPAEVDAEKILRVELLPSATPLLDRYRLTLGNHTETTIENCSSWFPKQGDYLIVRPDGSHYFLSAKSFEDRYRPEPA